VKGLEMDWEVRFYVNAADMPKDKGGVYLLFVDELLDYVGQSDNVHRRLAAEHHVYSKDVHSLIAFIAEEDYSARLSLERYFNHKYNPPNSFVGTEKQSEESTAWRGESAEERRKAWRGLKFEEFPVDVEYLKTEKTVEFRQVQTTDNVMGVPSIIALKPKDIRKG
jgi:hypothetical protein